MELIKELTRNEMRNVQAGDGAYLHCETPNGSESWYRTDTSIDPIQACRNIYPAFGDAVTGNYGPAPILVEE